MIEVGKIYNIIDVPQNNPCENCKTCLRLRMMELGLYPGERIYINKKSLGLWIINILGTKNTISSTLALRDDEFKRLCINLNKT
jgi:Fe2+ transport system protein FeoA